MHGTHHDIHARLDRLERANRRYRRLLAFLVLAAVGAGTISMAQNDPVPDVLRARSVEVVDDEGRPLVHLFTTMGIGAIATADRDGNPLVALLAERSGNERTGVITTLSSGGSEIVRIGPSDAGQGTVVTYGGGRPLASMGVTASGHGAFRAFDSAGAERALLGVSTAGHGTLMVLSSKGTAAADLAGHAGGGVLHVNNYTGTPVCTLDANEKGHGEIVINDRTGRERRITAVR